MLDCKQPVGVCSGNEVPNVEIPLSFVAFLTSPLQQAKIFSDDDERSIHLLEFPIPLSALVTKSRVRRLLAAVCTVRHGAAALRQLPLPG